MICIARHKWSSLFYVWTIWPNSLPLCLLFLGLYQFLRFPIIYKMLRPLTVLVFAQYQDVPAVLPWFLRAQREWPVWPFNAFWTHRPLQSSSYVVQTLILSKDAEARNPVSISRCIGLIKKSAESIFSHLVFDNRFEQYPFNYIIIWQYFR